MKALNPRKEENSHSNGVTPELTDYPETAELLMTLKHLSFKLFPEIQSLSVPRLDVANGLDFYDEVRRFEIDLISRALLFSGGNQTRAARLLGLNANTLHSMIKQYNIPKDLFTCDQKFLRDGSASRS